MHFTAAEPGDSFPMIWLRADGGSRIGFGHWVRIRRLGVRLSSWARVCYIVADSEHSHHFFDTGSNETLVFDQQQAAKVLGHLKPDCLITDLPCINSDTQLFIEACRESGAVIASIHDLGLGLYDSHLAIDPSVTTITPVSPERYAFGFFSGPQYAVLPNSFHRLREMPGSYPAFARTLLVSLGGGSTRNILMPLLPALERLSQVIQVTILTGFVRENGDWLAEHCPGGVHCRRLAAHEDPARMLFDADIALVAGGVTLYEAACLGTPALVVSHHELQQITVARFDALGIAQNLGLAGSVTASQLEEAVLSLAGDANRRAEMGRRGRELVDGCGAERIDRLICEVCGEARNRKLDQLIGTL
jgi:spore coat polysaccharide biosynthesis predicted glycosyltransferase SpsG